MICARISIFVGGSPPMTFYSPSISHRLNYLADFAGRYLTGQPARVTSDPSEYAAASSPRINYSTERITNDELWVQPQGLLSESGLRQQPITCFDWKGHPAFFKTNGDIPFDMFAAIFFLLSRYEEYLPHQKDNYGRYAHEQSLAYREGFLDQPLVNQWLVLFGKELEQRFPGFQVKEQCFRFLPTYDIDEAYSFRYKQWWRSAGAALKDLAMGRWKRFAQRRRVLNGLEPDPYDAFSWMDDLHRPARDQVHPRYFFLLAAVTKGYDRNNPPDQPQVEALVRKLAALYPAGLHPSWQSGDNPALLLEEKERLERMTGIKITASRQHYIRFELPGTYRQLSAAGIQEDYSMGYGAINGFRASVASPFYWYDLEKEQTTTLLLFPFCFMEANAFFEKGLTAVQGLDEMYCYFHTVRKVNGTFITVWHNTFLGTDPLFRGWREAYAQFFREAAAAR